jgi:hypothetical protein
VSWSRWRTCPRPAATAPRQVRASRTVATASAAPPQVAKYVLDKEVMGALKELRQLLQQSKGGQS